MNLTVKGLDKLQKKIQKMKNPEVIERAFNQACFVVEAAAREKAPKGNGELRRSIDSEVERTNDGMIGKVFTPLEYAPYVEYGTGLFAENGDGRKQVPWSYKDDEGNWHTTSGMTPQPYLRPALEENQEKVNTILMEGILND